MRILNHVNEKELALFGPTAARFHIVSTFKYSSSSSIYSSVRRHWRFTANPPSDSSRKAALSGLLATCLFCPLLSPITRPALKLPVCHFSHLCASFFIHIRDIQEMASGTGKRKREDVDHSNLSCVHSCSTWSVTSLIFSTALKIAMPRRPSDRPTVRPLADTSLC